jgi:hypothetical protein
MPYCPIFLLPSSSFLSFPFLSSQHYRRASRARFDLTLQTSASAAAAAVAVAVAAVVPAAVAAVAAAAAHLRTLQGRFLSCGRPGRDSQATTTTTTTAAAVAAVAGVVAVTEVPLCFSRRARCVKTPLHLRRNDFTHLRRRCSHHC